MNRLGIFVFYSDFGVVNTYIEYLLTELKTVINDLYIVINGTILNSSYNILKRYSDNIIKRNNINYDAGAYTDVIVNILGKDHLNNYDEIVLCNDTFFGPLKSFYNIFNTMEEKDCDFWGIDQINRGFLSYVIPYFCVFRKKIINSNFMYNYFKENFFNKKLDRVDIYARFEVGLTYNLKKSFKVSTYTNSQGFLSKVDPDKCIIEYDLPIIKKSFFSNKYFNKYKYEKIKNYVNNNSNYSVKYLKSYIDYVDLDYESDTNTNEIYNCPDITENDIFEFLNKNSKIYIVGNGSFAHATYFIFNEMIKNFMGYIVTKTDINISSDGNPIYTFDQIEDEAMIVALNKKNTLEVKSKIKSNNILFFWKDI